MSEDLDLALPALERSPADHRESGERNAPERPAGWQEYLAAHLFQALSPRERDRRVQRRQPQPPRRLEPFARFEIPRRRGKGSLAATWFPAAAEARGAVLLAPPWVPWGQGFFRRGGRIEALRDAGYHVMTFDFGGFGDSGPAVAAFYDRDVEDALAALRARPEVRSGLPVHFWGVSFGGYWAHPVLSRTSEVTSAVFEDVSPHLIEWSKRMAPLGYPCYLTFQHGLRQAYRYLDLRRHAPHLRLVAAAYVSGEDDRGVRPEETRELARLAAPATRCLIVPGADHLGAAKVAGDRVVALALETFEAGSGTSRSKK